MQETEAPSRRTPDRLRFGHSAGLSCEERRNLQHGRLLRRLPPDLQDAIIGRAYVWRRKDGEQVLSADGLPEHWLGVASGELLGRTRSMENGQIAATHVLSPGVWLNVYSPLSGLARRGIEFVASGPTCVVALSRADMLDLCTRWPELMAAILSLSSLNLRYAHLVLAETQSHTLDQKLLRWLETAARFDFASREQDVTVYRSTVPQAAMAASSGVSRQSWNAGMARMEAAGIIQRMKDGLRFPDPSRLEAAMKQHGLRDTAQYLEAQAQPIRPPAPLGSEARPISSLRGDEREALERQRWFERLGMPLRETLLSQMQVLRLPDKAALALADRQPPGWIAVVQGGLHLVSCPPARPAADGAGTGIRRRAPARATLALLPPGTTFFEHALIDGGNCGVDVCCEGDSTLLLMSAEAFRAALAAHFDFSLGVLKWLSFSHHQSGYLKQLLSLSMPLRLHAWLDAMARYRGQRDGGWVTVSMPLGQQEIAAWLSTTRQYVAKALNELEAGGRLRRRRDAFLLRCDALPLVGMSGPVRIVEEGAERS